MKALVLALLLVPATAEVQTVQSNSRLASQLFRTGRAADRVRVSADRLEDVAREIARQGRIQSLGTLRIRIRQLESDVRALESVVRQLESNGELGSFSGPSTGSR